MPYITNMARRSVVYMSWLISGRSLEWNIAVKLTIVLLILLLIFRCGHKHYPPIGGGGLRDRWTSYLVTAILPELVRTGQLHNYVCNTYIRA